MELIDLANFGALIGGVSVAISLVYLSIQIKNSVRALHISHRANVVEAVVHCASRYDTIMKDLTT